MSGKAGLYRGKTDAWVGWEQIMTVADVEIPQNTKHNKICVDLL